MKHDLLDMLENGPTEKWEIENGIEKPAPTEKAGLDKENLSREELSQDDINRVLDDLQRLGRPLVSPETRRLT